MWKKYRGIICLGILILVISIVLAYEIPEWTGRLEIWAEKLINEFFYLIALFTIFSFVVFFLEGKYERDPSNEIEKVFNMTYDFFYIHFPIGLIGGLHLSFVKGVCQECKKKRKGRYIPDIFSGKPVYVCYNCLQKI